MVEIVADIPKEGAVDTAGEEETAASIPVVGETDLAMEEGEALQGYRKKPRKEDDCLRKFGKAEAVAKSDHSLASVHRHNSHHFVAGAETEVEAETGAGAETGSEAEIGPAAETDEGEAAEVAGLPFSEEMLPHHP